MCYIQLSKGRYYKGFDSCIKINEKEVIVTEIKDNIEYTYILGKCAFEEAKAFLGVVISQAMLLVVIRCHRIFIMQDS